MKLQVSPEEGTPSPPSEQLIIPLLGTVSDVHANKRKHINNILIVYKIAMQCYANKKLLTSTTHESTVIPPSITLTGSSVTIS